MALLPAWGIASDAGGGGAGVIGLREWVEVQGGVVTLGDLLPRDIEPGLERMAAEFVVGRAPDPGTVLRLDRDRLALRLQGDSRFRGLRIPATVLVIRAGYALEREAIVKTIQLFLAQQKIAPLTPELAAALQWPQDLAASRAEPELEVTMAYPENGGWALRLRCVLPGTCAPFLVRAPRIAGLGRLTTLVPQERGGDAGGEAGPPVGKRTGLRRAKAANSKALVFAGRPARLVLERDGMRISIPVTCLDRGALAQAVRARDRESGRIFQARVAGPGLLEAGF